MEKTKQEVPFTVGHLRHELASYGDDVPLIFETWSEDGILYIQITVSELIKNVSTGTLTIRLY